MLLYFPCPNALAAFPILFTLCHQSSNNPPCETLFPSLPSEVSAVLKTGATSKKKKKLPPHQFLFKSLGRFLWFLCCRPRFTSSSPAFNTSGHWVLAQTETWWPSFENIKSCWSFCEVNRFHSVLSHEILGQERIRREKNKGDFNAILIASRLLQFLVVFLSVSPSLKSMLLDIHIIP